MAKRSNENSDEGRSLVKRLKDATTASVEVAATTFLQVFKGHDPYCPFKMLLIGETGSGKTSFLNLLCNCGTVQALGCGFGKEGLEHFRQFNNIQLENALSSSMESKTSAATLYNVQVGDLKIEIIDTPGFGDSRGFKKDEENVQGIIELLKKQDYINCVCLIINGRQARESASLKYVLTEITAILPRKVLSNVVVVFSNTNDPLELNFDPNALSKYFGTQIPQQQLFFIENPYCKFDKAKSKVAMLGIDIVAQSLQNSFEDTAKVLNDLCQKIKDFQATHTNHFIMLYEKKQAIEGEVLQLLTAYDNQVSLEEAISKAEEEVEAAVRLKNLNENFRTTQTYKRIDTKPTTYHNTVCSYSQCRSNCHIQCGLSMTFEQSKFRYCACISNDMCTRCGHSYTYHYHARALYEHGEVVKVDTDHEMQAKFNQAKSTEERATIYKKNLEKQREASHSEKKRLSRELLKKMKEFEELGMARNYAKLIETQLLVIDTRLKGTTGDESDSLRKTKEEIEKKLKLVQGAQSDQHD